jgi:hypothetical protein
MTDFTPPLPWPREELVASRVSEWQSRFPELRAKASLRGTKAVYKRAGVILHRGGVSSGTLGRSFAFGTVHCVLVDRELRGKALTLVLLHELGHVVLHNGDRDLSQALSIERDHESEQVGVGVYRGPLHERIEREAELFVDLVLGDSSQAYRSALTTQLRQPCKEVENTPFPHKRRV